MSISSENSGPKLASVVLLAYNQEKYITDAVKSLFAQTYAPLELILSDDCSSDRTFEIIRNLAAEYKGPHRVIINRNPRNCGTTTAHLNAILDRAAGEWVFLAAGDDISESTRVENCMKALESQPTTTLIHTGRSIIDENGNFIDRNLRFKIRDKLSNISATHGGINICGAATAFKKQAVVSFGSLAEAIRSEDKQVAFRCLLLGQSLFVDEPLVRYRRHSSNMTANDGILPGTSSSIKNYNDSQIQKYAEQLSYYRAFMSDLTVYLANFPAIGSKDGLSLKTILEKEIDARNSYLVYLRGSWWTRMTNPCRLLKIYSLIRNERNTCYMLLRIFPFGDNIYRVLSCLKRALKSLKPK